MLVLLMAMQAALGLAFQQQYRDADWIRATWYGNDWVTLVVVVPLLSIANVRAGLSVRWRLLQLGAISYAAYNYLFYLFGAALNAFLPLYVALVVFAVASLVVGLVKIELAVVTKAFRGSVPARLVGGFLMGTAVGLAAVWLVLWELYVFAARPTPIEPEAFKIVAALDLSWLVPSLAGGGWLLWMRRPWGLVAAPVAAIQAALYLLVLSVNSWVAIERGLTAAPGELPVWGPLGMLSTCAAALLLRSAKR